MSGRNYFVSVDIETDGPIIFHHSMRSIGAVAYSAGLERIGCFSVNIEQHGVVDPDTMNFWRQHPKAWDALLVNAKSPPDAMLEFVEWVESICPGPRRFIAHPTWFDYGFVRQYCLKFVGRDPFNRSVGDYAQQAQAAGIRMPRVRNATPHIALADAEEQGAQFVTVAKALRRR